MILICSRLVGIGEAISGVLLIEILFWGTILFYLCF